jgi:hypothetical protein
MGDTPTVARKNNRRATNELAETRRWSDHLAGTAGGAGPPRAITAWQCVCGWTGATKDLRFVGHALSCPQCLALDGPRPLRAVEA